MFFYCQNLLETSDWHLNPSIANCLRKPLVRLCTKYVPLLFLNCGIFRDYGNGKMEQRGRLLEDMGLFIAYVISYQPVITQLGDVDEILIGCL